MALYKGFSSFEYEKTGTFTCTDVDLVKLDLVNHLFTRRGERVGLCRFGTSIPDMPFNLLDDDLTERLREDVESVINYDPRVALLGVVNVQENRNTLVASAMVRYIELNITDVIEFNIQR